MAKDLTKIEKEVLMEMAEKAVTIPVGGKVGRWTREDRIAVVYSALCSMIRLKKHESRKRKKVHRDKGGGSKPH